jgi:hypothetical protein
LLEEIDRIDRPFVEKYNLKARKSHQLQLDMGPSPFEGNIHTSPVIILLANPGFDENSSLSDHSFQAAGWPLSSLHDNAPVGMRDWWRPRLRDLRRRYGDQFIASKVAALQINPWASTSFDQSLVLPSRIKMLDIAESCARRGAVLVIVRAAKLWTQNPFINDYPHRYKTNSYLSSYITENNLPAEAWSKINAALQH